MRSLRMHSVLKLRDVNRSRPAGGGGTGRRKYANTLPRSMYMQCRDCSSGTPTKYFKGPREEYKGKMDIGIWSSGPIWDAEGAPFSQLQQK